MSRRFLPALALLVFSLLAGSGRAASPAVYPVQSEGFTQSLRGDWSFKYLPALEAGADAEFYTPGFDASAWQQIPVPANWELKGFAEPGYDAKGLRDGLGLYRRTFRVPAEWGGGRRLFLRFEGVAYGFTVWVNGKQAGTSGTSAYDAHTFDITDALRPEPEADNLLAVQVTTKPFGWEFDVNDDWALSGIYREVTLFSVPTTFVQELTTRTKVTPEGAAELEVSVTVNQPGGNVTGGLQAPDGKTVSEFRLQGQADNHFRATVPVARPQLWNAETPSLYRLQLILRDREKPLQTIDERIGLREVSIRDGVLLLNHRPIKLRGVNHHDLDPVDGRAITEAEMRRDLELMKKGNINHIRASHYPPAPRFLELCDEMGFYVMDEAAVGSRGYKHLRESAYREHILARTAAAVTRDRNHASVIVWSIGNENPFEPIELEAARLAKTLDPTRPVCLPQTPSDFAKSLEKLPEWLDVYSPHYPTNAELRAQAKTLKRPTIYSEYAHSWGLAFDQLQDQWAIMQAAPQLAGGAIWHFQDQALLRRSEKPFDRKIPLGAVWLDQHRFYDSHDGDGADGIVYADRTPQTDFWQTRKVYAPVQIVESSAAVAPGRKPIALTVENHYDFRALAGMKLRWSCRRNGAELQSGEVPLHAAAHARETLSLPVNIPADARGDVLTLELRCLDETGLQLTERTVRLDLAGATRRQWLSSLPAAKQALKVTESEGEVKIEHERWVLTVARASGELTIRDQAGQVLVAGIYPHASHKFTMTETRLSKKADTWWQPVLTKITEPEIKVTPSATAVRLAVSGRYPRPEDEKQALVGGYQAEIAPSGAVNISYDYVPTEAKGTLTEGGLALVIPADRTEFRWIGQGPYAGYPGKDRLNEFGLFHLEREDLRFQGNRRGTELALLTTPAGPGVALATDAAADVAVERDGDKTRLSHNAVLSGLGNKGWLPETQVKAEAATHLSGSFTLVLLEEAWPAALTSWFGAPAAAKEVFHPFYHSYDQ